MKNNMYVTIAALLLATLTYGCSHASVGGRGSSSRMNMEGVFRFDVFKNDVPQTQEDGRVAMNDKSIVKMDSR